MAVKIWRALALAALTAPLFHCGPSVETYPNAPVILITVDTLRSDRLPAYGFDGLTTPAFDALARDGLTFERAYAPAPLTLPSHAGMMTGLLPPVLGVRDNTGFVLDDSFETLAERLKASGYQTAAFVSSMVLRRATGMAQGFDRYDDDFAAERPDLVGRFPERRGDHTLNAASQWLARREDRPFFLWIHLYDPHAPYAPPKPHAADYLGEIAYVDTLLGSFWTQLKQEGLYDRAVIALLSDHGEGLGDHGEREHGMLLYREALQVPFFLKLPGRRHAGARPPEPVSVLDVRPTLEAAVGLEPARGQGRSLLDPDRLRGDRVLYAESLYAQLHFGWRAQQSAIRESLHLIEGGETELYDLLVDPAERDNLFGSRRIPQAMIDAIAEVGEGESAVAAISEEDRAMLASLGYTGGFDLGDSAKSLTFADLVALKETVAEIQRDMNDGAYEKAEKQLEDLLLKTPDLQDAKALLGIAYKAQNKRAKAELMLMEALAVAPSDYNLLAHLAEVKLDLGKREEAGAAVLKAAEFEPVPVARALLPKLLERQMYREAASLAEKAVAREPALAYGRFTLGRVAALKGDFAAAADHLESAAELFSEDAQPKLLVSTLVFLADAYERSNRPEQGLKALGRALELDPSIGQTRLALAEAYLRRGRSGDADRVLEEGLADAPDDPGLLAQMAALQLRLGRGERARALAAQALAKDAAIAAGPLCYAYIRYAPPHIARPFVESVAAKAPASPYPLFALGRLDHAERRYASARDQLRACMARLGEAPDPKLLEEACFYLGDAEANMGNPTEARAYFAKAVELNPPSARNQLTLAALYVKLDQTSQAIELVEAWLRRFPAKNNYFSAHQMMRDFKLADKAEEYLKKAESLR